MSNYPGLWSSSDPYESLADDEQVDDRWGSYNPCYSGKHFWADTGMKWTYCMRCDIEGEWNMAEGYVISSRQKSSKVSDKSSDK